MCLVSLLQQTGQAVPGIQKKANKLHNKKKNAPCQARSEGDVNAVFYDCLRTSAMRTA